MAEGFSITPVEELPVRAARGRKSPYTDLLHEALELFGTDKRPQAVKVNVPAGKKPQTVYTGLKIQAKKEQFAGKVIVRSINGEVYIERGASAAS